MGSKTKRLHAFLTKHPVCCYCGGQVTATTQDHFPPRSLFHFRQWPEGYVFPACVRCNNATSADEMLVSMIARARPSNAEQAASDELAKIMRAVAEKFPDVHKSMIPNANQVKGWLRKNNFVLPYGMTTADVPILSLKHPEITTAIHLFSTKLFCSLYYMHTGQVLPLTGGVIFRWHSNEKPLDEVLPADLLNPLLTQFPKLVRQGTSLHEQFFYRYAVTNDGTNAGAFLVFFHQTLAFLGFVFRDIENIQAPKNSVVLRPFTW